MNKCTICDSKETQELLNWKKYKITRCNNCRLIFTTPLPSDSDLHEFYQVFMHMKPGGSDIKKRIKKKKTELKKLFNFPNEMEELSKKKFLDYGGGTGTTYKAMSELGLQSYYHDIDKESIEFTVENFGLTPEKTVGDIEKCDIKFDYILSDNVIEHVKSPYGFINKLLNKLEDGGKIVIKTPHASNSESFFNPIISFKMYFLTALKYNSFKKTTLAFFRRFWHCDPPRHIFSFSEKSLKQLMTKWQSEALDYEVSFYTLPWFTLTITREFFKPDKRFNLIESILIRLVIWPVVLIETCLQIVQKLLLRIGILSPAGIILKITKEKANNTK